ncbi:hypothetical protein D3C81_1609690 [compost metagenome]
MQHRDDDHYRHGENDDWVTQCFFNFIGQLLLLCLLAGQFKTADVQFAGKLSGANHRLVKWRKNVLPTRQRGGQ